MDDRKIIALFLERSEQAVDKVSEKYGKLCLHIAKGILPNEADAQECVNDAYLALWNTIPPEKPTSLRAYMTKLLRNIACDRRDELTAQMRDSRLTVSLQELAGILPDSAADQLIDTLVLRDALNAFLRSLSKKRPIPVPAPLLLPGHLPGNRPHGGHDGKRRLQPSGPHARQAAGYSQ